MVFVVQTPTNNVAKTKYKHVYKQERVKYKGKPWIPIKIVLDTPFWGDLSLSLCVYLYIHIIYGLFTYVDTILPHSFTHTLSLSLL